MAGRAPAQLGAASQGFPAVPELLKAMRSPDARKRANAVDMLADVVGAAYGEAGAEVGQAVRDGGGVALLSWLLNDPYQEVQQQALFLIGNLCSDSVDPRSALFKLALLQDRDGPRSLIALIFSDNRHLVMLACGALQNLCGRASKGGSGPDGYDISKEWSKHVVQYGVHQKLEQLVSHEHPMVQRYASGALSNIATHKLKITQLSDDTLAAIKQRMEMKQTEEQRNRYARDTITLAVRAMPPAARKRRVARARQRLESALRANAQRGGLPSSGPQSTPTSRSSERSYFSACTDVSSASGSTHSAGHAVLKPK